MRRHVINRPDSEEVGDFFSRAWDIAVCKQRLFRAIGPIFSFLVFPWMIQRLCVPLLFVIECHDKFVSPVLKNGRRESRLFHHPPDGRDAGVAVLRFQQKFGHRSKCRIPEVRTCLAKVFHGHVAVEAARAMDFHPVGEKINLDGRPFREVAVVAVDQCVEHDFPKRFDWIFRTIFPHPRLWIDHRPHFHISDAERHRAREHIRKRPFQPRIILKPQSIYCNVTDFFSHQDDRRDSQLREIPLWIQSEIQNRCERRHAAMGNRQHFINLFLRQFRKTRPFLFSSFHICPQLLLIQHRHRCWCIRPFIIVDMSPICFVAIDFIIRHGQICITNADIRALDTPGSRVIAGAVFRIRSRDFRRADRFPLNLSNRKHSANGWHHLIALFRHFLLKILQIINAHKRKIFAFIDTEQEDATCILIRKARKRIIQAFRTAFMRRFQFECLRFRFHCSNLLDEFA